MDILFLHHTIAAVLDHKGHSVQLLFAFEYIILASTAAATLLKYLLSMLDSAMEGRWEGKGTYVFYLELLKDMMHLFVYCIFFVIVFSNYGLPLHLVSEGSGCIGFRVQPRLYREACGTGWEGRCVARANMWALLGVHVGVGHILRQLPRSRSLGCFGSLQLRRIRHRPCLLLSFLTAADSRPVHDVPQLQGPHCRLPAVQVCAMVTIQRNLSRTTSAAADL
jgi:hypothetical protein